MVGLSQPYACKDSQCMQTDYETILRQIGNPQRDFWLVVFSIYFHYCRCHWQGNINNNFTRKLKDTMPCICFLAQILLWNSKGSTDAQTDIFAERKTVHWHTAVTSQKITEPCGNCSAFTLLLNLNRGGCHTVTWRKLIDLLICI